MAKTQSNLSTRMQLQRPTSVAVGHTGCLRRFVPRVFFLSFFSQEALANKYEGAEIMKETKKKVPIEIHVRHGQEKIAELELFSCSLVNAPERVDHES